MLSEGDREYLWRLSRSALLDALETELRFLGFYAHDDHETPAVIHAFLEKHLDAWRTEYLGQTHVQIVESPFAQSTASEGAGTARIEVPPYIKFSDLITVSATV